MQIRGRLIVVTGASSGIGAATALAMARRGGRLVLVARDEARLRAVAQQITSSDGYARVYPANLADAGAVATLASDIAAREGEPDVLINNAGAGRWLSVEDTSAAELESIMAVPYFAAFNLTRACLPAMRRRGHGHIVNVTSVAARLVWPDAAAYSAARCAMLSFSESLRAELTGTGIRVTVGIFGTVDTPYWRHNPGSEERLPRAGSRIRRLTAEEVAEAIAEGVAHETSEIVRPRVFRLLFLMNALAPRMTIRIMSRGRQRYP
jgi:short-subunit dehydrogenase